MIRKAVIKQDGKLITMVGGSYIVQILNPNEIKMYGEHLAMT